MLRLRDAFKPKKKDPYWDEMKAMHERIKQRNKETLQHNRETIKQIEQLRRQFETKEKRENLIKNLTR